MKKKVGYGGHFFYQIWPQNIPREDIQERNIPVNLRGLAKITIELESL